MVRKMIMKTAALAAAAAALAAGWAARGQTPTPPTPASAGATTDCKAAVTRALSAYEAALNAGDTDAVMPLYAADGVFMCPHSQSAVGPAQVRQAYDAVFKAIKFSVKFEVVEVVQMAPDWAFARTGSRGTVTAHATGAKTAEANQELFIFKKGADGKWNIARYSFSSTNPPPK